MLNTADRDIVRRDPDLLGLALVLDAAAVAAHLGCPARALHLRYKPGTSCMASFATPRGMVTLPGVFTPTEALLAARTGATGLKFFPASALGVSGINAIRAVLPADLLIAAVGGVSDENFADYARGGIKAFGLGSSLYKPGMSAQEIGQRARTTIAAYDKAFGA